ncbi:DNA/RNA nuclease SfsA [Methanobrevibacter sp.]|uniref:DNA/RNA nuclease SfsA n=1 Tax=Methanobrevibacter sp. TaxID=66852 RepID=UPI0025ECB1F4|nr:DNA/RNA nuclease SfsA [Methanobrevibacter sp.]MBQ2962450.1 DNA/RNA nuclease SfsA [Methanobrevibacter sp.]
MTDLVKAIFRKRANRFIVEAELDGEIVRAHLPNTGRCKELLVDGATVYLKPSDNPNRKTKYSLYLVENNGALVAMFSQQANSIVFDAIKEGKIKELLGYSILESEKTIGNSRIDIYLANEDSSNDGSKVIDETYVEVKSVTLIKDGVAQFPDAPTERGRKHLEELISLKKEGIRAVVFFLIEHPNGNSFRPNWENDPKFSQTLNKAYAEGVEILVYKTENTLESIELVGNSLDFSLEK